MWAGLWLFGLEAKQIATADTVGHGCECGIKCSLIFKFSIFTAHHLRDAPRNVPVEAPDRGPKGDQQVEVLTRRQGFQVLRKPAACKHVRSLVGDSNPKAPPSASIPPIPNWRNFKKWLLNYASNANEPIPVASAITTKKLNAPRRLASIILPNHVTSHQETRKIEVRYECRR